MKKLLLGSLWAAPALLVGGLAWSDYLATPGGPSTVFAFTCSATKICPASVLINSANTEIATAGAPLRIDPVGTTTQPVSGTVAATQSGVWTVQPGNTANTTAWLTTGTGGVFPSSQSGVWSVTAVQPTGTNLHMVCDSGCSGSGGTSSNFGSAFPAAGTAIGLTSGTNMVAWSATTNYGTAPAAIAVPAVNAFVTNSTALGRAAAAASNPVVPVAAASTAGAIVPNNTTAVVVKASAGTLFGVQVYGINANPAYLKIYNAASATCGTGTPVKRLMIPAAATPANGAGSNVTFGPGLALGTGITYCVTTGIADADTTAPTAANFLVNVDFE